MIRTRTRKILRDVWARKGRTALVSLAIFIGVTGTIALFSMSNILVGQLTEDIQEDKLSMMDLFLETDTTRQIDNAEVLQGLAAYPGVTVIVGGEAGSTIYFKEPGEEDFEDGNITSRVVWNGDAENPQIVDVFDDSPLEPIRLLTEGERNEQDGRWPEVGKNELVVERRMADEYDLKVGDKLIMRVPSASRVEATAGVVGTEEEWTIVGIAFDPYAFVPKTAVYTTLDNSNYLTSTIGFSTIETRFQDYDLAVDNKQGFQDCLTGSCPPGVSIESDGTGYIPRFIQTENPASNSLIQQAKLLGNLLGFLALVALVVSGFLVINVISSLVVEQKRQIGVMKSLGASRGDAFFIYSGIAFMYGLIGVIPGVIVGIPAGNAAAHALSTQVNTVLEGFKTSTGSIILGVVVGLLVPVIASLLPVFNGTRVRILEAITDLGIDANYGSGPLAKLISKLPIPVTVRQGLSNVSIKKTRLLFTVITLAVAVGAFMGITGILNAMTEGIQSYIDTFNVQVGVAPVQNVDPLLFETALKEQFGEDIKSLEYGFSVQVEFDGYEPEISPFGPPGILAYGYNVESSKENRSFEFTIDKGEDLTVKTAREDSPRGIIFSSALATNMNVKIGDIVTLRVPGNTEDLKIIGISDFLLDQVWLDWETLADIANYRYVPTDQSPTSQAFFAQIPEEYLPAVQSVVRYVSNVDVDGPASDANVMALGLAASSEVLPQLLQFSSGELFSAENPGVVISSSLEAQGYKVGDEITLNSTLVEDAAQTYTIVGVFADVLPPSADGPVGYVGILWSELASLDQLESKLRPQIYFLNTPDDEATADDLNDLASDMSEKMVQQGMPIFYLNLVELTDQISQGFMTIQAVLSAVVGLSALVGALGLLTTLSMSVFERQKEIGVMRSIGASSRIVATQFLTEGIVVGVIAWLLGIPIMILVQMLLIGIIGDELFTLAIEPNVVLIGLIGMMVITVIASLWPSLGAARKTVSDILRYQ